MYKPVEGIPSTYKEYLTKASIKVHLTGVLRGSIWVLGLSLSILSAEQAGPAISYCLGQGATMVVAAWGVFVWKEFKEAPFIMKRMVMINLTMAGPSSLSEK